jgi:hypothetical protein
MEPNRGTIGKFPVAFVWKSRPTLGPLHLPCRVFGPRLLPRGRDAILRSPLSR